MTTAQVQAAAAAGPEIMDPALTQQLMLDAPFGDDLCVISARSTGKSWGIVVLVARDATHWKQLPSCLNQDDLSGPNRTRWGSLG